MIHHHIHHLKTAGNCDVHDITSVVETVIAESKIQNGIVTVFFIGSTGGITTIEFEPGLKSDIKKLFQSMIPYNKEYAHHKTWGDDNGSSHLQSALLKTSLVVPLINSAAVLGRWQQIVVIDFDTRPRNREIVIQVMGELQLSSFLSG